MAKQHLIYQVAVGKVPDYYECCIDSVARYATRIGADHIVQREPILKIAPLASQRSDNALRLGYLPIYEKECAFSHLGEYQKVAIIDADVYVKDSAPDVFDEYDTPFAGVVERELPCTATYRNKLVKHSQGQFSSLTDVEWLWDDSGAEFYNMGVMLLSDSLLEYLDETPQKFLKRPEFERFVNGEGHWRWSTDQTLLNWWLKKEKIRCTHLNWRWNALYGAVSDVSGAYFVHFFLSDKLPRKGAEIPEIAGKL